MDRNIRADDRAQSLRKTVRIATVRRALLSGEHKAAVAVVAVGALAIVLLVVVFLSNMDWSARP